MAALGGLVIFFIVGFLILIGVALTVFWIWMLVCAIQNKGLTDGEKIGWVLAIVFFHFIGSILYLFIGHPKRLTPLVGDVPSVAQLTT